MDQFGEFGLGVPVPVSPIFKPLGGCRLGSDKGVADRGVFSVWADVVEGSRVGVLVYCDLFVFDGDGEWFRCHGFFTFFRPVSWCRRALA